MIATRRDGTPLPTVPREAPELVHRRRYEPIPQSTRDAIRHARLELGWTLARIAAHWCVSDSAIYKIVPRKDGTRKKRGDAQ